MQVRSGRFDGESWQLGQRKVAFRESADDMTCTLLPSYLRFLHAHFSHSFSLLNSEHKLVLILQGPERGALFAGQGYAPARPARRAREFPFSVRCPGSLLPSCLQLHAMLRWP